MGRGVAALSRSYTDTQQRSGLGGVRCDAGVHQRLHRLRVRPFALSCYTHQTRVYDVGGETMKAASQLVGTLPVSGMYMSLLAMPGVR